MDRLRRFYPDPVVLFTLLLLSLMGLLSVVSVKVAPEIFHGLEPSSLKRPLFSLVFTLIGFLIMSAVAYFLDYRRLNNQKLVYSLVSLSLLFLVVVLLKKVALGKSVERWLIGTSVQPSEFSRIIVIVFVAYYVARKGAINRIRFFGWAIVVVVAHSLLLFLQPDKGMSILILTLAWLMLWIGGTSPRVYLPVGGLFFSVAIFMFSFGGDSTHRRVLAWQNPLEDSFGSGYQVIQSILAFMDGGLLGQGYGKGLQKLGPLTQADTDYVLATVGEEMGLPGITFLFLLYLILFRRLLKIAQEVADTFGKLLVVGVMLNVLIQATVNVMMSVNLLPPKGMPLPFVSYGISNMLANFIAFGIVGSVYKEQLRYRLL